MPYRLRNLFIQMLDDYISEIKNNIHHSCIEFTFFYDLIFDSKINQEVDSLMSMLLQFKSSISEYKKYSVFIEADILKLLMIPEMKYKIEDMLCAYQSYIYVPITHYGMLFYINRYYEKLQNIWKQNFNSDIVNRFYDALNENINAYLQQFFNRKYDKYFEYDPPLINIEPNNQNSNYLRHIIECISNTFSELHSIPITEQINEEIEQNNINTLDDIVMPKSIKKIYDLNVISIQREIDNHLLKLAHKCTDKFGYIYCFKMQRHTNAKKCYLKIGKAFDPPKRINDWKKSVDEPMEILYKSTESYSLVERLIHLFFWFAKKDRLLKNGKKEIEWFLFDDNENIICTQICKIISFLNNIINKSLVTKKTIIKSIDDLYGNTDIKNIDLSLKQTTDGNLNISGKINDQIVNNIDEIKKILSKLINEHCEIDYNSLCQSILFSCNVNLT